ncbi:MAG: hypothetical protein NVSMB32_05830 [Actinomycetota bacterium]
MAEITVFGAPWCPDTRRSKRLLGEARIDFEWVDVELDPEAEAYVRRRNGGKLILPTIEFEDGSALQAPSAAELAAKLGVVAPTARHFFDLIIVGAGPAGLTAALYAVREGIHCLVIERGEPGGQASRTAYIQGSPGFPDGTPGAEVETSLLAQAHRYGVRILRGDGLTELARVGGYLVVVTEAGEEFSARCVVIATGATYAALGVPGEEQLRGAGVHLCASCEGPFYRKAAEILVVGGGELALQEALFLTQFCAKVRVLEATSTPKASALLLERVRRHPKIELHTSTEIVELTVDGEGKIDAAMARDRTTGYAFAFTPDAVFVYAGMTGNTGPLAGTIDLDEAGFVLTDATSQSSLKGVFAAGDVRAGATRQLGSAIGDGAAVVVMVRRYLEELGEVAGRASA